MSAAVHATDPSFELPPPLEPSPPAVEVRASFRGITTHACILTLPARPRARAGRQFTIGWQRGVDAPVAPGFVPWATHPLVLAAGRDYVINTTAEMSGQVRTGGRVYSLAAYTADRGRTFALPEGGEATLDCGPSRFVVARTEPPRALPAPVWRWSWRRHGFDLAGAAAVLLLVVMLAFVPEDPRSLALDIYGKDGRMVPTVIKPPVPEETLPDWVKQRGQDAGGAGSTAAGASGAAGDHKAPQRDGRFSVRRRAGETTVRLSKQQAADAARSAGILGIFKRTDSSSLTAILGADDPLGDSAADVIGHLQGAQIASAYGAGGLDVHGTGAGAAGTGDGLQGHGGHETVGMGGDGTGPGHRYGALAGNLHTRQTKTPDIVTGIAEVRGTLDKEIIRRIVRQHLHEVKYCYERALAQKPSLGGRIVVHFAISGQGQVLTSVLQSSTLGNAAVENCAVAAVKRWQFPAPRGGGLAMVSYPFMLAPAGG